jgi:2,4-dienoyl-CoA reductase-like NADH-dependent reductase (Old Yellow Enzyme family)
MTERLCTWDDENPNECGKPTKEYLRLYKIWGEGRIGVTVLGNIPCDRRYPEAKRNAVIDPLSPWDAVAAFKPVIEAARVSGSIVIGQVTHAGRVSYCSRLQSCNVLTYRATQANS